MKPKSETRNRGPEALCDLFFEGLPSLRPASASESEGELPLRCASRRSLSFRRLLRRFSMAYEKWPRETSPLPEAGPSLLRAELFLSILPSHIEVIAVLVFANFERKPMSGVASLSALFSGEDVFSGPEDS